MQAVAPDGRISVTWIQGTSDDCENRLTRRKRTVDDGRVIGNPTVAFLFVLLLVSCGGSDLRGKWSKSRDGKTYLVVDHVEGLRGCEKIWLDGKAWPYREGVVGGISPGNHTIACNEENGADLSFTIPPSVIYHFDYWGP
jgi:hypothetical protein